MSDDTLARRWNHVLDALTAYLARELTPSEAESLGELVTFWNSVPQEHAITTLPIGSTTVPAGARNLTITFGHAEDSPLSSPVNAATVRVVNSILQSRVPEESFFRDYDE